MVRKGSVSQGQQRRWRAWWGSNLKCCNLTPCNKNRVSVSALGSLSVCCCAPASETAMFCIADQVAAAAAWNKPRKLEFANQPARAHNHSARAAQHTPPRWPLSTPGDREK